jgi:chorismate synthase
MAPKICEAAAALDRTILPADTLSGDPVSSDTSDDEHFPLPVLDKAAGIKMAQAILSAAAEKDSAGGIVEVAATGIPAGIGGAMYGGLESFLAPVYFGIPAVKGIEFGAGFAAAEMKGSENNDSFAVNGSDITTKTNNAGGILGGITNGMPFIARLAFKPTPSIGQVQDSVDLKTMEPAKLEIKGRHDPCVAVRAVPVVIAATALGLLDAMLEN